jgi:hypothetical protein
MLKALSIWWHYLQQISVESKPREENGGTTGATRFSLVITCKYTGVSIFLALQELGCCRCRLKPCKICLEASQMKCSEKPKEAETCLEHPRAKTPCADFFFF